jgi:hypothetical protein
MRVKLCTRCPYLPCDLAGHYDPEGALHLCATCDREQETRFKPYPRKATGGKNAQQSAISL